MAADMPLFNVLTRAFLIKNVRTYIAAPAGIRLVLHARLNVARKSIMVETNEDSGSGDETSLVQKVLKEQH